MGWWRRGEVGKGREKSVEQIDSEDAGVRDIFAAGARGLDRGWIRPGRGREGERERKNRVTK